MSSNPTKARCTILYRWSIVESGVTQHNPNLSLDLILTVNCWQTPLEKPIIPNQPNQSSKMSQNVVGKNEDAFWVGTKMITIGLDLGALRMLLYV